MIRRTRRFTTPDSFHSFMEGLRALQTYEEEASKDDPSNPPARTTLDRWLTSAAEYFERCFIEYPGDVLPRYYRATVLALQAQVEISRQLEQDVNAGLRIPSHNDTVEQQLQAVAGEFRRTALLAPSTDVAVYAFYNEAQTLAKAKDLQVVQKAFDALSRVRPDAYMLAQLGFWQRLRLRVEWQFRRELRAFNDFVGLAGDTVEGTPGMKATTATAAADQAALEVQVKVLWSFLRLLLAGRTPEVPAADVFDPKTDPEWHLVTLQARKDIEADSCNKRGFLFWKHWVTARSPADLSAANENVTKALTIIGRPSWTPAQINRIRLFMAEGRFAEAKNVLTLALGAETPMPPIVVTPPSPDPAAIASEIVTIVTKTALSRDTQAIGAVIRRAYGTVSKDVLQRVAVGLAGTIDAAFLEALLDAIGVPSSSLQPSE